MSEKKGKDSISRSNSTPEVEEVRILIREMLRSQVDHLRNTRKELDLDAPELEVMLHLMANGECNPTEIARRIDASTATTSLILQRLEGMGHIGRRADPLDGRKVLVSANKASLEAARKSGEAVVGKTVDVLESLSASELKVVGKFLKNLVEAYRPEGS